MNYKRNWSATRNYLSNKWLKWTISKYNFVKKTHKLSILNELSCPTNKSRTFPSTFSLKSQRCSAIICLNVKILSPNSHNCLSHHPKNSKVKSFSESLAVFLLSILVALSRSLSKTSNSNPWLETTMN